MSSDAAVSGKTAAAVASDTDPGGLSHRQILTIMGGLMIGMFLAALVILVFLAGAEAPCFPPLREVVGSSGRALRHGCIWCSGCRGSGENCAWLRPLRVTMTPLGAVFLREGVTLKPLTLFAWFHLRLNLPCSRDRKSVV